MYLIRIGRGYFSARRGYCGGVVARNAATQFSLQDATEQAASIVGATVVSA
jgi:mannose/fructose/N-acetylgalactosamine-specific phosphotransferase system component IID